MNEHEKRKMASRIIATLYDTWAQHGHQSLNGLIDEEKWDKTLYDDVIGALQKHHGLVELHGVPNVFDLTTKGVLYAEDNGIPGEDVVVRHRAVRAHILSFLASLYDSQGSRAHAIYYDIAKGAPVLHDLDILVDVELLRDLGYIEAVSSNSYRITRDGLEFHQGETYTDIV